ncbi:MAG: hypothetical protein AB8A32_03160 [Prochlorococcus sp.]
MPKQQWFDRLRGQIKDRCGPGWGIADRNGDTQLTRRLNDGKQHKNPRQSVQLGVPWNPAYSGDIFLKICQLKQLVEVNDCSLAEAKKKQDAKDTATPTITRSVDDEDSGWEVVIADFIEQRRQKKPRHHYEISHLSHGAGRKNLGEKATPTEWCRPDEGFRSASFQELRSGWVRPDHADE